ncbi:MAG: polysaccharide biosynthesis/export family protein [Cytophagaceae bacterium]|nr:polysaccharide biosynthesis/export family protein [Cytophagaceae bacterium]
MKFSIAFFVLLVLISFSCVTHKDYRYLIPSPTTASDTVKLNAIQKDYALQVGDVLDIKVSSNVGSSEVEIFNKRFQNSASNSGGVSSAAGSYLGGYIIDQNGNIDIPLIGKVYSKGLTCYQLNDTIGEKLSQFINYASVTTKLGFFRITILGEVTAPGTKELINNSNLNVYQAIGYAGDVTDVGDKKKVKLIRKDGDKVTVVKLDISGMSLIDSKYYYLQPNDVLYIEPLRAKVLRSNSANIALALSALTFIIVLLNYYQR